jgi:hypothetical protein
MPHTITNTCHQTAVTHNIPVGKGGIHCGVTMSSLAICVSSLEKDPIFEFTCLFEL